MSITNINNIQPRGQAQAQIVTVDRSYAAQLLTLNTNNRPLLQSKVNTYAAKQTGGTWLLTGQAHIIISWDNVLLNGQHTLTAVVQSGVPITTVMVTGIDPAAFAAIDIGLRRSAGNVLAMIGADHPTDVAAIIRAVTYHDALQRTATGWTTRNGSIDNDEVLELFMMDPDLWQECAQTAASAYATGRTSGLQTSRATIGAFTHIARRAGYNPTDIDTFTTSVATDTGHTPGAPATSLRRWLLAGNRQRNGIDAGLALLSGWIKAFDATVNGRQLAKIYGWNRSSPEFPSLPPCYPQGVPS